jgi:hypothetical protein
MGLHNIWDKLKRAFCTSPVAMGNMDDLGYGIVISNGSPADQGYAPYCLLIDVAAGVKYNAGTKTTASWTSLAASGVTLQTAFAAGSTITGAAAATPVVIGDGTDSMNLYATNASNMAFITTNTGTDLTIAPAGGDVTLTGTLDVSSTFTVATNKLSVNATTGTVTIAGNFVSSATTGNAVAINTNKFLVAADTGNTTIAGDCAVTGNISGTFTGTWGGTAWNANPTITLSATTGQGVTINGDTVTTGDILYLTADASLNAGYFIRCYDSSIGGGTDQFSVADTGVVVCRGPGIGSGTLTLSTGNLVVSDGNVDITTSTAHSGDILDITRGNSATGGNAIDIAMGTAAQAGNAININFGNAASSGHAIALTYSGANTGDALNLNMTNNVAGGALVITGAGTRTDQLIDIVDVPGNGAETIYIAATAAHNSGNVISIVDGGAYTNNVLNIAYTGNNATGDAINITMTSAAVAAQAIVVTGKAAFTSPLVSLTAAGADGGDAIYVANTGGHANANAINILEAGTSTNNIIKLLTNGLFAGDALNISLAAAAATAQAIVITDNARGANATSPTVALTTATGNAGYAVSIANTSSHNSGHVLYISESGTTSHNVIGCVLGGAFTGDVLNIAMAGGGAGSQAVVVTSNVAHSGAIVSVAATGNLAGGTGMVAQLSYATGTMAVATSGFLLNLVDTSGAQATSYCLQISSDNNEALYIPKGVVKITEAISADGGVTSAGQITTTDGVSGGTARVVGGRAYSATASGTTHTNTTDETVLGSYDIPASTLKAGTTLRVRFGVITPSTNAADTYTVRLRLGPTTLTGTALITTAATDVANNDVCVGNFALTARAAPGAAAECVGCGTYNNFAAYGAGVGGAQLTTYLTETNFATNGILKLEVTGDWSAANASDQAHLDFMYVEIA